MSTYLGIRDNQRGREMKRFLSEHIHSGSQLSIVSAYFTIYAYLDLKGRLDTIEDLRFLFGQPRFISEVDSAVKERKSYQIEDDALTIPIEKRLYQNATARECAAWIRDKVQIRSMVKPNFLHGKLYHIRRPGNDVRAILGSSNFTIRGLGMGKNPNIELNLEVTDRRDQEELFNWFEELWNDQTGLVRDVKDEVLKYLEQLYANNSPEFVYYKTLYHLFEKYLSEQAEIEFSSGKAGFLDSQIWNQLFSFQKDAVKGAINKLEKHGGCIIADSVGLGKTYEALAIIRYYEALNYRVLVICPKKLRNNWTLYQDHQNIEYNPFPRDRFSYTLVYHTDLGRYIGMSDANSIDLSRFNWGAFDLIVIDESHNLRGNPRAKERDGEVIYNRAKFLMENVIRSGVRTKVLMLSATPVNTSLKDLRNQIHYITEGRDEALMESCGIEDLSITLRTAQGQFATWMKESRSKKRNINDLMTVLDRGFFKILDELTIARSRKHIQTYYQGEDFGSFPQRLKPRSIHAEIDLNGDFYSYDKVNDEISEYMLSIFKPSSYLKEEYRHLYETQDSLAQFNQLKRESILTGMMKVNFMKRLESSISSFTLTLERTLEKIKNLRGQIELFLENKGPSQEYESGLSDEELEELEDPDLPSFDSEDADDAADAATVGKKRKFRLEHLRLDQWLADLKKDQDQISSLYYSASRVLPPNDAKLHQLKQAIQDKIKHPINPDNKKILIFTAFADTANYLYEHLSTWAKEESGFHSAIVTGSGANKTTLKLPKGLQNDFNTILTCFAPQAKERHKTKNMPSEQIDLLIGTDCISEGQNLQDCDFVINYDIHWNPVRIIQRYGRIDRLNSPNNCIQMLNFWPTENLDQYIQLKHRVESRMIMVDITATGQDNVISTEDIADQIPDELRFRAKQLKKLQTEVIDLEDITESVSLTDFNLDDFRADLLGYLKVNEKKLREAPMGIFAITPSPQNEHYRPNTRFFLAEPQKQVLKPGVVFCLRLTDPSEDMARINALHPYFLVYIHQDGEVRFHYSSAKQSLELFRILCIDQDKAIETLCDIFDQEITDPHSKHHYDKLLKHAITAIKKTMAKRSQIAIQNERDAIIPVNHKEDTNQFELVTWLIIK